MPPVRPRRRRRPTPRRSACSRRPTASRRRAARSPTATASGRFDKDGDPHVIKRAKAAYEDRAFPQEAHELRSRIFVAHIRFATNGENLERNTHPFIQHGRIFAHNGVVHGLDEVEARLRPEYRALVGGETDSERVFALITQEIDDRDGDVTAAITAAVTWIAETVPLYAVNILLATPDELWALRYPETHDLLWLDEREAPGRRARRPPAAAALRRRRPRPGHRRRERGDGRRRARWTPLGPGELLHVARDLTPTVTTDHRRAARASADARRPHRARRGGAGGEVAARRSSAGLAGRRRSADGRRRRRPRARIPVQRRLSRPPRRPMGRPCPS